MLGEALSIGLRKCTWLLLLVLWVPLTISAQQAPLRSYTLPDPYQRSHIEHILQVRSGLIWLGTPSGLFAFDGNEYIRWIRPDSLKEEVPVTALFEDQGGILWVGYADGSICQWENRFNGLTLWIPEEGQPKARITGFAYASGNLWIATYGEGVYIWRHRRLYQFGTEDGLPNPEIYCITADSLHRIWVGTDAGLTELQFHGDYQKKVRQVNSRLLPDQIVQTLLPDRNGNLWIGFFEGQVAKYTPETDRVTVLPRLPKENPITCLLLLEGQELWAGTESGDLWRYPFNLQRWIRGINETPPTGRHIHDLILDRENNIWIASQPNGLLSFYRPIEFIDANGHSVQATLEDGQGRIWAGTPSGLFILTLDQNAGLVWPPLPLCLQGENIISLARSSDGSIWAGTFGNGVFQLDHSGKIQLHISEKDGLGNGNILSITPTDNNLWMTTLGGVSALEWPVSPGSRPLIRQFGKKEGLSSQFIYSSYLDTSGKLWFGSDGEGLSCMYPDGQIISYRKIGDQELQSVYSITADHRGHIWFSTANKGILEFDGKDFYALTIKEGLRDLAITGLFTDRNGRIIILHQQGIDVLDPERRHLIYYDESVGLEDFDPNLNALSAGRDGTFWIGTAKGLVRYTALSHPGVIDPTTILKSATLLNGRSIQDGEQLSAHENYLRFTYTGLWYTDPKMVLYRYKLEGADLDWKQTRDHEVTFSSLPPGKYTLRVQATENGAWLKEPEFHFSFTIQKPWWQQTWFLLLSLILIGLAIRMILRLRDKRIQRDVLLQREKIELQLETLKSQINPHFLFNSFNTLLAVIESDPIAAARYVEELSDFYRQILAYREKDVIPLEEELLLIGNYKHLLEKRFAEHVRLDIHVPDKSGYVVPLTLQLLVENAVKHNIISQSKPLTIHIFQSAPDQLIVENNLQKKAPSPGHSTGFGLHILRSHYLILTGKPIQVVESNGIFRVHIPIIPATT